MKPKHQSRFAYQFWLGSACCILFMLTAWLLMTAKAAEPSGQYKVGDRLPQNKGVTATSAAPVPASKPTPAPDTSDSYKEIRWEALIPKNWDPSKDFKNLDMNFLNDGDPRAMAALQTMREAWDKAPVEASLNGTRIRIPGFIVPLDGERGKLREFLLVPYFGGCIHTPPPPANQIIDVVLDKPAKIQMMDAVWVSGVLETTRSDTSMGSAGYRLKGMKVEAYVYPK
ncbi:DUF3299 domain-containing protein [Undibacterium sp. TC4M20W]|uniref:DUF3299 domain-containing protein n=1 Tax=Undibacterium sp. TC4M20W TaxID=3413052 RepID=UPI003BF19851